MFIDPLHLIDQTIDNLELLCEVFKDEVDERIHSATGLTPEARLCKEAALMMQVLLPKLRAARATQIRHRELARGCVNCDLM